MAVNLDLKRLLSWQVFRGKYFPPLASQANFSGVGQEEHSLISSQVVETLLAKPRFTIYITQKLYTELMMHIMSNYPKVACGMLGTLGFMQVVKHYPAANFAENITYKGNSKATISDADLTHISSDVDNYDGEAIASRGSRP